MVELVRPGVTTEAIDKAVFSFANGARRLSGDTAVPRLHEILLHSINPRRLPRQPDDKPLREGDIVNIDITLIVRRLARRFEPHVLCGRSAAPGRAPGRGDLRDRQMLGIEAIRAGRASGATSAPRSRPMRRKGALLRGAGFLCGHGVVPALPRRAEHPALRPAAVEGAELKAGMIFTVEPMINLGRPHVKILSDGWTAVTRETGSLSAQFEHTIGVTETGLRGSSPCRRRAGTIRPRRPRADPGGAEGHRERLRERFPLGRRRRPARL